MVLFEGDCELKRALVCLLGAKMYTTFRNARICALRGERVKVPSGQVDLEV